MEGSVKTQVGTTVCKSGFHQDQATLGGGRPKAIEGRGRWKYQRTSEHLTKKYILVMSFKFSSFNSTNAFYFGLSQKQASLYKLTPSFQGTIPAAVAQAFIHCGANETSQDKEHNARPCGGLLRRWGQTQGAGANRRPRKWTCTSGSMKCQLVRDLDLPRDLDFKHKQGQQAFCLGEPRTDELSLPCTDLRLCPMEAVSNAGEMWMLFGLHHPRGLFTPQ